MCGIRAPSVRHLLPDHTSHPSPGHLCVAFSPRNQMYVGMENGLAGRCTTIDADVETRYRRIPLNSPLTQYSDERIRVFFLDGMHREVIRRVTSGNDEEVSGCHGILVLDRYHCPKGFHHPVVDLTGTKRGIRRPEIREDSSEGRFGLSHSWRDYTCHTVPGDFLSPSYRLSILALCDRPAENGRFSSHHSADIARLHRSLLHGVGYRAPDSYHAYDNLRSRYIWVLVTKIKNVKTLWQSPTPDPGDKMNS